MSKLGIELGFSRTLARLKTERDKKGSSIDASVRNAGAREELVDNAEVLEGLYRNAGAQEELADNAEVLEGLYRNAGAREELADNAEVLEEHGGIVYDWARLKPLAKLSDGAARRSNKDPTRGAHAWLPLPGQEYPHHRVRHGVASRSPSNEVDSSIDRENVQFHGFYRKAFWIVEWNRWNRLRMRKARDGGRSLPEISSRSVVHCERSGSSALPNAKTDTIPPRGTVLSGRGDSRSQYSFR